MNPQKTLSRQRHGFTLMEVMLVLVILVIIAGTAVTALGPIQRSAQMRAAKNQIGAFRTPLEAFKLDMGDYPAALEALVQPPADMGGGGWNGPYLDPPRIPLDPWGNPYRYVYPSQNGLIGPDIWSAGPNRTDGDRDNVTNWIN